jgi:hypothetical protein
MNDLIGLGIIGFLVLCAVLGLYGLSRPYNLSVEEFEKRAQEGPGLLGAGLVGLQKALDPALEKAVIAQEDLREGRYNKEQGSGDPPEAGDPDNPEQLDG